MNGSDLRELERHSRDFGAALGTVWSRRDGSPPAVAILDALACAGLKLVPDDEGVASAALFTSPAILRGAAA